MLPIRKSEVGCQTEFFPELKVKYLCFKFSVIVVFHSCCVENKCFERKTTLISLNIFTKSKKS